MKKKTNKNLKKALATALCVLCIASIASCSAEDINKQLGIATNPPITDAVTDDDGNTVYKGAYGGLFDEGKVINIDITMAQSDRSAMLATPENEEYYSADVSVDGVVCKNVGFRTRGNVSFVSTTDNDRYSYKINFGKFTDGTFEGLDELCLNNMAYDPSYVREYLTYASLAKLGAPSPLATFANVTVNGELAGLYLAVEAVDDSFLMRVFGSCDGTLYKANRDSTMISSDTATFEVKSGDDVSKGQLKAMLSKISDVAALSESLDISSVLKYAAVNAVIANEDSYLGEKAQNFYFYNKNGSFSMIPWDFNLAFGTDTSQRKDTYTIKSALAESDISTPYFGVEANERPLVSNLLENDEYYKEYIGYVTTLAEFFEKLPEDISSVKQLIENHVKNDTEAFYTYELFENEFDEKAENSMMGFVKKRTESIKTQLSAQ